jgi:hypothetical protein
MFIVNGVVNCTDRARYRRVNLPDASDCRFDPALPRLVLFEIIALGSGRTESLQQMC